ncbi:hypothetical protein ODS41_11660 [Pyrobaculum sp. 3827-6]|uniref:hypothetical protein n=1 Tax=Pyrobaculum sp. 3827-6 TaxID=2983604 RepID=UPI0021DA27E7|nr:hypothetical protein [Pyrobaculum sp. 3827-6]MCU7788568.1 hypothetical protein [Pyrobaculum sp. 3827-6]
MNALKKIRRIETAAKPTSVVKLAKAMLLLLIIFGGQYTTFAGGVVQDLKLNGHLIQVTLDEKQKPFYNITSLTEILTKYNFTHYEINKTNAKCNVNITSSNLKISYNVNVIVNKTWVEGVGNYSLAFGKVIVTNGTVNFTFYVLVYKVVGRDQPGHYNFTTITIIYTKPNGEYSLFYTRIDSTPFKKNVTATEIIIIRNATTLADSYRIIGNALKQVKNDSPRAWDIAYKELNKLAKFIEKEMPQYNGKAPTVAIVTDFDLICCVASIGNLIACALGDSALLGYCPLCAQLIPCIGACINIFTAWTCLLCVGTSLAGCVLCALGVGICVYAAQQAYYCCLR